jgi:hypothetical protein
VKPSKILSVTMIFNSDPPNVHIKLLCSLRGEADALMLQLGVLAICHGYRGMTSISFAGAIAIPD